MATVGRGRMPGKVALVSGAARGIGAAIGNAFLGEGASVLRTEIREPVGAAVGHFHRLEVLDGGLLAGTAAAPRPATA